MAVAENGNGSGVAARGLVVVSALLCAAGLLYLSVPRAVAAFLAVPTNRIMENARSGRADVTPADARALAISRYRSLVWSKEPRYWSDLAYAQARLAAAARQRDGRIDRAMLDRAGRSSKNALALTPTDSNSWMRLAYVRLAGEQNMKSAAPAFGMALLTGPVKVRQTRYRLDIGFRLWPVMSPDDRQLMLRMIRTDWRHSALDVVDSATSAPRAAIVRLALLSSLADLALFDRVLAQRAKGGAR